MAERKKRQMKKSIKILVKLSCYLMFFAAIFGASAYGGYLYITPSSYISLNSNPSVKYTVNRFNRVIEAEIGSSSELKLRNLMHRDITDAIALTIDEFYDNGDVSEIQDIDFVVSVVNLKASEDKANSLAEKLNNEIRLRYGKSLDEKTKGISVLKE